MLLLWAILLLIRVRQHFCYVPERIYFNSDPDSPPLVTLSSIGLAQCINECKARKKCYSIRYKRTFRLCFLHQEENALSPTVSERGFVSARKADWNMASTYSYTCLKRPLKIGKTKVLKTDGSLMQVESMQNAVLEHSAIGLTCIKR